MILTKLYFAKQNKRAARPLPEITAFGRLRGKLKNNQRLTT